MNRLQEQVVTVRTELERHQKEQARLQQLERAGPGPDLRDPIGRGRAAELQPRQPLRGELSAPRHPGPQGSDRGHPGDHRQPHRVGGGRALRAGAGHADAQAHRLLRTFAGGVPPGSRSGRGTWAEPPRPGQIFVVDPGRAALERRARVPAHRRRPADPGRKSHGRDRDLPAAAPEGGGGGAGPGAVRPPGESRRYRPLLHGAARETRGAGAGR